MKYQNNRTLSFKLAVVLITALILPAFIGGAEAQERKEDKKQKDQQKQKPAEEQEQGIKLGAALVTVPFNVTDSKNRYINDLNKEDLEVLEDGKTQEIFSFERQTELPITVAMLIDISGSQQFTLTLLKAAGQKFFRKVLRPSKDLGAVVTFENESVVEQDLTGSVERLQQALDSVRVSAAGVAAVIGGTPPISNSGAGSTAMYDSIYAVSSELLGREAGRRVIVLLTDGVDTSSRVKSKEAIERAWRSEIIIYSIGIGDRSFSGVDRGSLKRVSSETGGRAFFPNRDEELDEAFALIDEDLRSQYLLAYQPANDSADGSFRTIKVNVKARKDLVVRHRRGYFAAKAH